MSELSPQTQALLRAARSDGPSAAARAQIWSAVGTSAAGATAVGSAAAKAAVVGGVGGASAQLLVMGALLGSTITVGVAAFMLRIGPGVPALRPDPTYAITAERDPGVSPRPITSGSTAVDRGEVAAPSAPERDARGGPTHAHASEARAAGRGAVSGESSRGAEGAASLSPSEPDDFLAREAFLLAQARGALVRGHPDTALSALRAARALPVRALEPETLSLEAHALRAEGHFDEADQTEARLRERFPDHALAR